jgi:hypothetical protein
LERCRKDLAGRAEADKTPWGPPEEGVQCRLRPEQPVYPEGRIPLIGFDARNVGERDLWLPMSNDGVRVEVDGRWYAASRTGPAAPPSWFGPDCQRYDGRVGLGPYWRSQDGNEALAFAPGKHVIRVALVFQAEGGRTLRVIAGSVEVQVGASETRPAPPPAASRAAELTEEDARILAARLVNEYLAGKEFKGADGRVVPNPTWTKDMWRVVEKRDGRWLLTYGAKTRWSARVSCRPDGSDAKVEAGFAAQ